MHNSEWLGGTGAYHTRNESFKVDVSKRLRTLCQKPTVESGKPEVISDKDIQEISECLQDLEEVTAMERPRTFAVLHMMNRTSFMGAFEVAGLFDNSFPYASRRSLPPAMRLDQDACHQFLELQRYVLSDACQMENGARSSHVHTKSGDLLFKSLRRLGSGGEATVDEVQSRMSLRKYARKRISRQKDLNKDKEIRERFENELQILKKLDHNHLVRVFASYTDSKYVAILMNPIADMDLRIFLTDHLKTKYDGLLPLSLRKRFRTYFGCIASAVAYIHSSGVRHKDIKPSNILLKRDQIYITDFGTAIEFDGDNSTTRGTVRTAKTTKYQSPEVARGERRGTASDVWSLGVTFLEMITILRGESLEEMQKFMYTHGTNNDTSTFLSLSTKYEHVYENIPGAMQWLDYLRKNTKYPRIDNSPMQWIKDMLLPNPANRPRADQLVESIKQAADGQFCGKCCKSDHSDSSSEGSNSEDERQEEMEPLIVRQQHTTEPSVKRPKALSGSSGESRLTEKPVLPVLPILSTRGTRKSPFHQVSTFFSTVSSLKLGGFSLGRASQLLNGETSKPFIVSYAEPLKIQERTTYIIPGAFPEFEYHEPYAASPPSFTHISAETMIHAQRPKLTTRVDEPIFKGPYSELDIPAVETTRECIEIVQRSSIQESNTQVLIESDSETAIAPEDSNHDSDENVTGIGSRHQITKLLLQQVRIIKRAKSDEHLKISCETESLIHDLDYRLGGEDLSNPPRRRSFNLSIPSREQIMTETRENMIMELKAWHLSLIPDETLSVPASLESISPDPVFHLARSQARSRRASLLSTSEIFPNLISNHIEPDVVEEANDRAAVGVFRTNESENDTVQNNSNVIVTADEEINSHVEIPPPAYVEFVAETPVRRPYQYSQTQSTNNPLREWLSASRQPTQSRLTTENIDRLNARHRKKRLSPATFTIAAAREYKQKVCDDAASSVATSVMSANTRSLFAYHGLMLPLQDVSADFLGKYTKLGKADAVRMLLKVGCNPGTKNHPRPSPIFNTIKGASSRHNKCLRALIEHKVNVNVRSNQHGKTPLMMAVEQTPWKGYQKTIFLLMKAGANPGLKDKSGDVPLLKILGGGSNPLEEYHRNALAILLDYPQTTVNVTPLGTQNKPLHLAIRRNDGWAVGLLLDKDTSVIESKNSEGLTPLLLAASMWSSGFTSEKLRILDLLLESGAKVNAGMPETHKTPLHIAIALGLVDAVQRLTKYNADSRRRTSDGKSASDFMVTRRKQHRCVDCDDCAVLESLLEDA